MAERGNRDRVRTRNRPKSSDWFNFGVGFIATMCAVWAPRIASVLLSGLTESRAEFVNLEYLFMSVTFGVVVAVVIMFQKWEQSPHSWSIFVGALAVPSLLAGVFNSTAATYEASAAQSQIRMIQLTAETSGGITFGGVEIPVLRAGSSSDLEFVDEIDSGDVSGSLWFPGAIVSPAYAGSLESLKYGSTFYGGLNLQQPQALIVLENYETRKKAIDALAEIRINVPDSRVVKMRDQYFILESAHTRAFADALEEAIRLREAYGYSTTILNLDPELSQ